MRTFLPILAALALLAPVRDAAADVPPPAPNRAVRIHAFGFQIVMPSGAWRLAPFRRSDGRLQFYLHRMDLPYVAILAPFTKAGTSAAAIAADIGAVAASQGMEVSAVRDEGHGRFAVTARGTIDGLPNSAPIVTWSAALPHPGGRDAYLVLVATVPAKDADLFFDDLRAIADSVTVLR